MDPEKKVEEPVIEDESALDAELEASINSVKAGNELAPKAPVKVEEKVEEKPGETVTPKTETPIEDPSKPQVVEKKEDEFAFRIPNKGKFESDESYEKRIELLDLVKQRKAADTPEKQQKLSEEIAKAKGQLKNLNSADKINNLNTPVLDKPKDGEDPALVADRERLKELGGVTKEDMLETLRQERFVEDQKSTLNNFVSRHEDLKDEDVREVFFDFVDNNYNWATKSGKELMTVLELARESMFRPDETIQERVLKGANVQEKVNAMQFPGGTGGKAEVSPEMRKSIDELKATGMTEEKAMELLAD